MKKQINSVEEYITQFPIDIQNKLHKIRNFIKENWPDAIEKLSYAMPAFFYFGPLIYYAPAKNHIGIYPTPSGVIKFHEITNKYKTSKGAILVPLNEDIPLDLLKIVIDFKIQKDFEKANNKTK